jgi:hypothetical protein
MDRFVLRSIQDILIVHFRDGLFMPKSSFSESLKIIQWNVGVQMVIAALLGPQSSKKRKWWYEWIEEVCPCVEVGGGKFWKRKPSSPAFLQSWRIGEWGGKVVFLGKAKGLVLEQAWGQGHLPAILCNRNPHQLLPEWPLGHLFWSWVSKLWRSWSPTRVSCMHWPQHHPIF